MGENNFKLRVEDGYFYNVSFYYTNGYLYYYFRYNGKTYQSSTGSKDKKESIEKVRQLFYKLKSGKTIKKKKQITFSNICKKFIEWKTQEGLKEKTIKEYRCFITHLEVYCKNKNIYELGTNKTYFRYIEWKKKNYTTNRKPNNPVFTLSILNDFS